jgi:hypothetical protein
VEMFLRVRPSLEFSHDQDPQRSKAGLESRTAAIATARFVFDHSSRQIDRAGRRCGSAICNLLSLIVPGMVAQGEVTERVSPMHPSEEFLKHAAECKRMARLAREPQDRLTWKQMSERWLRCAQLSVRTQNGTPSRQNKVTASP